ncbi:MAG: hypothetical protein P8N76_19540 [Pirellulaceae bacterium]|nr:hypothetical protein [Pirellulaceae bacterium]
MTRVVVIHNNLTCGFAEVDGVECHLRISWIERSGALQPAALEMIQAANSKLQLILVAFTAVQLCVESDQKNTPAPKLACFIIIIDRRGNPPPIVVIHAFRASSFDESLSEQFSIATWMGRYLIRQNV